MNATKSSYLLISKVAFLKSGQNLAGNFFFYGALMKKCLTSKIFKISKDYILAFGGHKSVKFSKNTFVTLNYEFMKKCLTLFFKISKSYISSIGGHKSVKFSENTFAISNFSLRKKCLIYKFSKFLHKFFPCHFWC